MVFLKARKIVHLVIDAYRYEIEGDKLIWYFDNIMLPHEAADEEGSMGYVYFKVKPLTGWGEGTVIPNTAAIYFDFNPPIITNTFTTTFSSPLNESKVDELSVGVYPNPTTDFIQFTSLDLTEDAQVTVFDMSGKIVLQHLVRTAEDRINVQSLSTGAYILQLKTKENTYVEKLIKS